jgi:1-acyl-sn-glycerol-3-phosphate acyltransferase
MSDCDRDTAPSAEEIERKLRSLSVKAARPALWAGIELLKFSRGFNWQAHFEHDVATLESPVIFAANHRSHVDTAAILDTLPPAVCRRTVVAAALDVFGRDSNGGWQRRVSKDCLQFIVAAGFHAYAFDRLGPALRSVRTSVQLIRNGWNLLLFPEGTRSRNGEMASFKPGVSLLAKFTGRPVVPIHVDGGEAILPYRVFMPQQAIANVRYGEPLWYTADDTPMSFAARLESRVRELGTRQPERPRPVRAPKRYHFLPTARPQTAGAHHPY